MKPYFRRTSMRGLMCPYGAHAGAFKRCGNVENRACVSIYGRENLSVTLTLLPAEARVGTGRTGAAATRNVGHVNPMTNIWHFRVHAWASNVVETLRIARACRFMGVKT
jgi:hypothetical protein